MDKLLFVAWLFIFSGCGLVIGGVNSYEMFRFWNDGQSGVMVSSDKLIERAIKYQQYDLTAVDVTYLTSSGSVFVPHKILSGELIKRLGEGQKIPVRFLKSEPERVQFDNEELDSPWGWLIFSVFVIPVAFYALRLLKQEPTA